jgi:signal transduction histidine kinase
MIRVHIGSLPLRARIMAIVIGGAILPLALIGAWLAASTARSGRALLQSELDSSLADVSQRIVDRWQYREAELGLLANNEPGHHVLETAEPDPDAEKYLQDLARTLRPSIREFSYRDSRGRVRWTSDQAIVAGDQAAPGARAIAGFDANEAMLVRRPVLDAAGATVGIVEARVLLSAMLPTDSLRLIVAGAALAIRNRDFDEWIGGTPSSRDASLVATRRTLDRPPLDLRLAASDARYVQPFSRAARLGLLFLLLVATVALVLTAFLTRRLTRSLEELVDAAGAVASGDLERSVPRHSDDEVGRLAAAFNAMTESLRRTLGELSQREALAAVGRFAATMSHEVRNALTSVRLDVQRLNERVPAPEDRALAKRALRNVHRLDTIVTGSLRVARTNPEAMRPIAIEGVLRAAMTAAEPTFLEHSAEVRLDVQEGERARVRGDPGALEQLFLNLLLNAAQAMPRGGLARISTETMESVVVVRITDMGCGIQPDQLTRMGEPFSSSKPNGTGLGFPIARQIAITHGGDVRVVATGRSGTTVEVTLPRLEPSPAESVRRETLAELSHPA